MAETQTDAPDTETESGQHEGDNRKPAADEDRTDIWNRVEDSGEQTPDHVMVHAEGP